MFPTLVGPKLYCVQKHLEDLTKTQIAAPWSLGWAQECLFLGSSQVMLILWGS